LHKPKESTLKRRKKALEAARAVTVMGVGAVLGA
jgi:hypothetical protein